MVVSRKKSNCFHWKYYMFEIFVYWEKYICISSFHYLIIQYRKLVIFFGYYVIRSKYIFRRHHFVYLFNLIRGNRKMLNLQLQIQFLKVNTPHSSYITAKLSNPHKTNFKLLAIITIWKFCNL